MQFDPLVANPGRLRILTALAVEERQEFVRLREATRLTDGNLASHARRLQSAGFIAVDKQFRGGKPVTHFTLMPQGRLALEAHARRIISAVSQRRISPPPRNEAATPPASSEPRDLTPASTAEEVEDDWVD
jgi:DNA-binding MarR family transcriptional regulator